MEHLRQLAKIYRTTIFWPGRPLRKQENQVSNRVGLRHIDDRPGQLVTHTSEFVTHISDRLGDFTTSPRALLMRRSILTEKIARRGHHLLREYRVDPFALTRVWEVMTTSVESLPGSMTLHELARFLTDPSTKHPSFPVIDTEGRFSGSSIRHRCWRGVGPENTGAPPSTSSWRGQNPRSPFLTSISKG
jgi:hypothetical protein